MTLESHGDNYHYHLLMLYLSWRQKTEDLLGEYSTAWEALLAYRDVHTIIINEMSMVSYETLEFIHQRLTEIKGTDDTEVYFGGLNIIAIGDFYQLSPVRDRFVFQNGRGYVLASMEGPIHNDGMIPPTQRY